MTDRVYNVLFLCTHNSARSIIAEALLNHMGGGRFRGFSAGSQGGPGPRPLALRVLQEDGISTEGLSSKTWDEFGLTQVELAETMGLSDVHVNRVLQHLRAEKLITLKRKKLVILDLARLKSFSGFNHNYLHLAERNGTSQRAH